MGGISFAKVVKACGKTIKRIFDSLHLPLSL